MAVNDGCGVTVKALRGATTVSRNEAEAINEGAAELVAEILQRNYLQPTDLISVIFTVTQDLTAAFPATGARRLGLDHVPLICSTEIPVPGSQEKCIRCLIHAHMPAEREPAHVYLHAAQALRPDLTQAAPQALPAYRPAIDRIVPYVPGKPIEEVTKELGLTDVIKLASNENSLGPSPKAIAAVTARAAGMHRYPDGGAIELRQALARHTGMEATQVFVGNGSDEVIKLLAEAYLNPGDEVIAAAPTFSEYTYATRLMGATEVIVPLLHGKHDLSAMAERITNRTKLVFICNPNNPTGTYVGRSALAGFLRRLPAGVLVICDEAYFEYVEAPDFPNVPELIKSGLPVVCLRTFSKVYGLAGLRIGYALAPAAVVERLQQVKEPFNVNLLAQAAAVAALTDSEHVVRSRAMNSQGKLQLYEGLSRLKLLYRPTQANFICVDINRPCRPVYESMLQQGVIVRACVSFGLNTHLRISVGTPEENARCLAALEQALRTTAQ